MLKAKDFSIRESVFKFNNMLKSENLISLSFNVMLKA